MLRSGCILALAVVLGCVPSLAVAQRDVQVPDSCTPQINQKLFSLLGSGQRANVDNVMVCGITISSSRTQRGGPHGSHEILPLRVTMPDGNERLVEVVINDALDGVVTAPVNASVFAFGQAFFPSSGKFAAGIHDVHCSTHQRANNG